MTTHPDSSVEGVSAAQAVTWGLRLLEPDRGMEHQDVGADQRLDAIENRLVAHQIGGPAIDQIGFQAVQRLAPRRMLDLVFRCTQAVIAHRFRLVVGQQLPSHHEAPSAVVFRIACRQHDPWPVVTCM
jgi:hypothetical protein